MGTNLTGCLILLSRKASAIVAADEINNMSNNSSRKLPNEVVSMWSFSVIKLNNITPKISDKLLSYVINSLSSASKFYALGMVMTLLMTANGMAFIRPVRNDTLPK